MNEALNSDLKERLFALRDEQYKAFQEKLIPHIATQKIIGIRTPVLRRFALEFAKTPQAPLQGYDLLGKNPKGILPFRSV